MSATILRGVDAPVAQPLLTAASADAELLSAVAGEPQLLVRLTREAEAAYRTARAAQGCDWSALDTIWARLNGDLRRAATGVAEVNQNSAAYQASLAGGLRAALGARQAFLDMAVPVVSEADRLASQPVSTVVLAHRLMDRNGPHPMEPMVALPGAVQAAEAVPGTKARRSVA